MDPLAQDQQNLLRRIKNDHSCTIVVLQAPYVCVHFGPQTVDRPNGQFVIDWLPQSQFVLQEAESPETIKIYRWVGHGKMAALAQ